MIRADSSNNHQRSKKPAIAVCIAFLVILAGCTGPINIGGSDPPAVPPVVPADDPTPTNPTPKTAEDHNQATKAVGEANTTQTALDKQRNLTNDTQANKTGQDAPTDEIRVINGSPDAGLSNATLRNETLQAAEFLYELPRNRTRRNRTITRVATDLCDAHDRVVPDNISKATGVNAETYRNTYRVAHTAEVLHDTLGADIDVIAINRHMRLARTYGRIGAKITPVTGSYNRLHNTSCAVKRGEPGAKEDFYIATTAFVVDLALLQHGVIFKAAFKTTGVIARQVGLMRLARVCGYKCVGLVESELHWALRGTYHGSLEYVTEDAIEGNLTAEGYNKAAEQSVSNYLEQNNITVVNGVIANASRITDCFKSHIDPTDILHLSGELKDIAQHWVRHQELPADVDLSLLAQVDEVERCVTEID